MVEWASMGRFLMLGLEADDDEEKVKNDRV